MAMPAPVWPELRAHAIARANMVSDVRPVEAGEHHPFLRNAELDEDVVFAEADGLAVALADAHATDRRGLHGLELLATGPLRLATTARRAAGATEGTLRAATTTGTTRSTAAAHSAAIARPAGAVPRVEVRANDHALACQLRAG